MHTPGPGPSPPGSTHLLVQSFLHPPTIPEGEPEASVAGVSQAGDLRLQQGRESCPKYRKRPPWGSEEGRELERAPMCTCAPTAPTGPAGSRRRVCARHCPARQEALRTSHFSKASGPQGKIPFFFCQLPGFLSCQPVTTEFEPADLRQKSPCKLSHGPEGGCRRWSVPR